MLYIFQILSAILIAVSIGSFLASRSTGRLMVGLIAAVLGVVCIVTGSWIALVAGVVVFLGYQATQRDTYAR